ncbi:MAG: alpha/beta fold hydrolase [Telluria sp.]
MNRRDFLACSAAAAGATLLAHAAAAATPARPAAAVRLDAAAYHRLRRFAALPQGRIAYVEHGAGPAALFLHGAPLNGYQWRGALERLAPHRRCIAPDFMGLGYSEVPQAQALDAHAQADMLASFLDALGVRAADLVASDSGGAVAQLFLVRYPERVRSLLLTNCDVEPDSPPAGVQPAIRMARAGTLADATAAWLSERAAARATFGAAVFAHPERFDDATIDYYVKPLVSSPLRRAQYHAFHLALEPNPLRGIEAALRQTRVPVRIVWGGKDTIFALDDARYLQRILPGARSLRVVPDGKLFFQEEYPDVIAAEALALWPGAA